MKKIILLLFLAIGFSACETDFETTSDWKEIPIVYGVLDLSKSTQYIRINKAFLGQGDANEFAQIADSLYFPASMPVELRAYSFDEDEAQTNDLELKTLRETYTLERVEGNAEGLDKEEGVFQDDPFYVYKFDQPLNPERAYELYFQTPNGLEVTALTPIIDDFRVSNPEAEDLFDFQITNPQTSRWQLRWRPTPFAVIYDVELTLHYNEMPINDVNNTEAKTLTWLPVRNFDNPITSSGGSNFDVDLLKQSFVEYVSNILLPRDGYVREITKVAHTFTTVNEELKTYININSNVNGIASNQVRAEYTNVNNGLGVFASRYVKVIENTSFKSLGIDEFACEYPALSDLGFTPSRGQTSWPDCQ